MQLMKPYIQHKARFTCAPRFKEAFSKGCVRVEKAHP